jgi:hypothetical protein
MMFKTAITSLALTAGLITHPSIANDDITTIPMDVVCVHPSVLSDTLEEFGEIPFLQMNSTREIDGRVVTNPTVMFMNPETKTWTMAERLSKNVYCVIAIGDFVMPFRDKKGI